MSVVIVALFVWIVAALLVAAIWSVLAVVFQHRRWIRGRR